MAGAAGVDTVAVLDAQACAAWTERVLGLRAHWTRRDTDLPFYTLGLAAYLDAARDDPQLGGRRAYHVAGLRQQNNQLLAAHFAPLFELCCQALAQWTGQPVHCLGGQAALPGFHIHLPHPMFAQAVASRHVDLQFRQVFGLQQPDPRDLLTVTLPLSLPSGAGLHLWFDGQPVFHAYQLGHLALHTGLVPHQAVLHPHSQDVPRIMLQCHALRQDGRWGLYW